MKPNSVAVAVSSLVQSGGKGEKQQAVDGLGGVRIWTLRRRRSGRCRGGRVHDTIITTIARCRSGSAERGIPRSNGQRGWCGVAVRLLLLLLLLLLQPDELRQSLLEKRGG